eukprot:CAMPEP_0206438798 /NCGR_PEP_ID=MMETSP0324_2-20121206/11847_1 /ASSEMBLY_ACC=CAM_ASM_000836 /TAXON_ID=2866 /ORGANISM="Crypthecodinium cohnii, Strain Seligo" /LENGTH=43 /DNA_ID= /DNA_START= /DNA_END= /DNA_ORIENTATION=
MSLLNLLASDHAKVSQTFMSPVLVAESSKFASFVKYKVDIGWE